MEQDKSVSGLMKTHGMYVKGQYEAPEIRVVAPEHLVRCGFTSAYDAQFGLEVGAGAMLLLLQGIHGVTVTNVDCGVVKYIPAAEAIEQRFVDPNEVALYEQLGYCFGREPATLDASFAELHGALPRIYK